MGVHFDHWKRTMKIKVFDTVEDWEIFKKDCSKLPSMEAETKPQAAMRRSKIHRGYDEYGNKLDSEYEFVVAQYFRRCKGLFVEKNKTEWLPYYTDDGVLHKWFYDFRISSILYEVKGRVTHNDTLKMKAHPDVRWLFGEDVRTMRKELDENHPGWIKTFMRTN